MSKPLSISEYVNKLGNKDKSFSGDALNHLFDSYMRFVDDFIQGPLDFHDWLLLNGYYKPDYPPDNKLVEINRLNLALEKYNAYLSYFDTEETEPLKMTKTYLLVEEEMQEIREQLDSIYSLIPSIIIPHPSLTHSFYKISDAIMRIKEIIK